MSIINVTQHKPTPEQIEAGVVDLPEHLKNKIAELLTFDNLPSKNSIKAVAHTIAILVNEFIFENTDYTGLSEAEKLAYQLDSKHAIKTLLNSYTHPKVLIGGAPFLMSELEGAFKGLNITPVYAFSKRESVERTLADGSIEKVVVFKHLGFVEV